MATTRDIDRLVRTYIDPKVSDLVFKKTPMLDWFYSKAKKRDGYGTRIDEPLEIGEGQAGTYSDIAVIDRQRTEVLNYAYYRLGRYFAQFTVSHIDKLTAMKPEDVVGIIDTKSKNAFKTMRKLISTDLNTGTGTSTTGDLNINGLRSAIYAGASNTYGGHASTAYTGWTNQYRDMSTTPITWAWINLMLAKCNDGGVSGTDVIMTDKFIWSYIWANLLQPMERYTGSTLDKVDNLPKISNVPILTDAVFESSGNTSGYMYFISGEHLYLRIHRDDNMKAWPFQKADTQFAWSKQWTLSAQLCCNNRERQGVIYGISVPALA